MKTKQIIFISLIIALITSIVYEWNLNREYCWDGFFGRECLPLHFNFVMFGVIVFLISALTIYFSEKILKINGKKK